MATFHQDIYEYQVGGSLPPGSPTYVRREADDLLFQALKAGRYCYVLNSRQMGKSSLRVATMRLLRNAGIACASVDLSMIGKAVTQDQWYAGLIRLLMSALGLGTCITLDQWWNERQQLSAVQHFGEFLETILLTHVKSPVVLFMDEIDSLLGRRDVGDDCFAVVRGCYNARAEKEELNRLTFALVGVADPTELIEDKSRTPFNIGFAVPLRGFTYEEAAPLSQGLAVVARQPQEALREVLTWTGGQPFLTQKLCKLVTRAGLMIAQGAEKQTVTDIVSDQVIRDWETKDEPEHLKTIRNRIVHSPARRTARLLSIYLDILRLGEVQTDDSPEHMELRLSGLVVEDRGRLRVYNPIYAQVFDSVWAEKILSDLRPYASTLAEWLKAGRNDESRLLHGAALRDAQKWAIGKSLGQADYEYLAASQQLEAQVVQKALEAQQEANRILTVATNQAKKRTRYGTVILIVTLVASGTIAGYSAFRQKSVEAALAKASRQAQVAEANAVRARAAANKARMSAERNVAYTVDTQKQLQQINDRLRKAQLKLQSVESARAKLAEQAQEERDKQLQRQKESEAILLELQRQRAIAEARLRELETQREKAKPGK
jgi:AAA-like domain